MNPDPNKTGNVTDSSGSAPQGAYPLDKYSVQPKSDNQDDKSPYYRSAAPEISLPKGGGALKGIDEKFSVNAVNGTAGMQVPLPLSPGRGGFTPALSLSYNSGGGNSEFGLGWSLSLPSIQRRTDKQLPQYNDTNESDVFLLAGAEDLQPLLTEDDSENWSLDEFTSGDYIIKRYRPRIEGLFARIELIKMMGSTHKWWKVTTKDNIVTFYGLTTAACICDPADNSRIFKWLPEFSYDNKGNVQQYTYLVEDTINVPRQVHERNRLNGLSVVTNKYLGSVSYCNSSAYYIGADIYGPSLPPDTGYLMEAVMDYGDHDASEPLPQPPVPQTWPCRKDPFSDLHAGFEIRTYRLCRRVLMFHSFSELNTETITTPCLVRSLDIAYQQDTTTDTYSEADLIVSLTTYGYTRQSDGSYIKKGLPALTMEYQPLQWSNTVNNVSKEDIQNAPQGLTGAYQWIDLNGEGLPGILTEQAQGWFYKQNLGDAHFTPAQRIATKPSFAGLGTTMQWQDLQADGRRQLVSRDGSHPGYFELDDDQDWQPFVAFKENINVDWDSPFTKMLDLNGDGRPDLLLTEERAWTWYENQGTDGFTNGGYAPVTYDEEKGPRMLLNDMVQSIFLADMNGDGMTDIVRIQNGSICYWPNKGYGRFGAKVTMSNAPLFDTPDQFNPVYLTLADISGTGAADILYLGKNKCTAWINLAGNAWGAATVINGVPPIDQFSKIAVMDLLGNGTPCIVWSSPLPQYASAPMRYIDLMGGNKPYLATSYANGMGKTTTLTYKQSTKYYLEDQQTAFPWATRLPFPVHCVSQVVTADTVSQTTYTQLYTYHHGYYDHEEREFRGFGRVDTLDTDVAVASGDGTGPDDDLDQAPVLTKTWYHTGAWMRETTLLTEYRKEYYPIDSWGNFDLPATFTGDMNAQEQREACRALKSSPLRQEIYALDNPAYPNDPGVPYTVTAYAYGVTKVQPVLLGNIYASFYNYQQQSVAFSCERNTEDPRIQHQLTLDVDEFGNVLQAVQVVYPRVTSTGPDFVKTVQARMLMTCSETMYTNDAVSDAQYRLRVAYEGTTFELNGLTLTTALWDPVTLKSQIDAAAQIKTRTDFSGAAEKRIVECHRILYLDNDAASPLGFGVLSYLGLPYQKYTLALTDVIVDDYLAGSISDFYLSYVGYASNTSITQFPAVSGDDWWWLELGTVNYGSSPSTTFYTPLVFNDPYGNTTTATYLYYLLVNSVTDALGNVTTVDSFNWACLHPTSITDINLHTTHMLYDALGLPVAIAMLDGGDSLDVDPDPDDTTVAAFFADPIGHANTMLGSCTWRCMYNFNMQPMAVAMIGREMHMDVDTAHRSLVRLSFTDGLGRQAMHKVQGAYPDDASYPPGIWISTGKTVYNNKGKPVLQYEPYLSNNPAYDAAEQAAAAGVSPRMHYDPLGRVVRTDMPDGTFTTVVFDAWMQSTYDAGDNALGSTWYTTAMASGDAKRVDAATKSAAYADTPVVQYLDTLGRSFYTDNNGLISYAELDITGNRLYVQDARNIKVLQYAYNMLNVPVRTISADSGTNLVFTNGFGGVNIYIDALGLQGQYYYDALMRPLRKVYNGKILTQWTYGDTAFSHPATANMAGRLYQLLDGAGQMQHELYDFKGNVLSATRTYASAYDVAPDWLTASLESSGYTTWFTYDALNRVLTTRPISGVVTATTTNTYDAAGRLSTVNANVSPATGITAIAYNAKGQRTRVQYANGTFTTYAYDPDTFRVTRITTTRSSDSALLQDLQYWYDAAGNITWQTDGAQQAVFFYGTIANPDNQYTYDNPYRLITATGREHAGHHHAVTPIPVSTSDTNKMCPYTENYTYDDVGKMMEQQHTTTGTGSWTRTFDIDTTSNKTLSNTIGSSTPITETYHYDARGNITSGFNHLTSLTYNEDNQLQKIVDASGLINTYYQYDGNGQRVRKVTVDSGSNITQIRLYVGQWEVYRKSDSTGLLIQRETIHVMDDSSRVAVIDSPTGGSAIGSEVQLLRYQYSNHLGTATLEVDDSGSIISYEEYYAYGGTSFQAGRSSAEVSLKRYRYIGKELDDESGFYYMGARYYVPWLCRWIAVDPLESKYTPQSPYVYCSDDPVSRVDLDGRGDKDGVKPPSYRSTTDATGHAAPMQLPSSITPMTELEKGQYLWNQLHPDVTLPKAVDTKNAQIHQGPERTPAYEKMQDQIKAQKAQEVINNKNRELDPYANDMAKSPGVQAGMALIDPAYGATMSGLQLYSGVQTGNNVDVALGITGLVLSSYAAANGNSVSNAPESKFVPSTEQQLNQPQVGTTISLSMEDAAKVNPDFAAQDLINQLSETISVQKQGRHIAGTAKAGGGYLNSIEDAQAVLDAVHSGDATLLGISKTGNLVFRFEGVTGTNVNLGANITGQPTNVFIIKGTKSPSVVPTNPYWKP